MEDPNRIVTQYFSNQKILIADENISSRTGLAKALVQLGAKMNQITLAGSSEWALQILEKTRPSMIISDYSLGAMNALELFQHPSFSSAPIESRLSAIVTHNTSQAAVAQAAEGDVDVYVSKPYSLDTFRAAMVSAAMTKLQPTDYMKTIEIGRRFLAHSDLSGAIAAFTKATELVPNPSLAYYYQGHTRALDKALEDAQASYLKGLEYNNIHYKCLLGLYEAQIAQRNDVDAYYVLKRITRNFPLSTKRFGAVLRLAVITGNYDDIEQFYQLFLEIDIKSDDIVKPMCAALITAGKYFLREGDVERGLRVLHKAGVTVAGRPSYLTQIILTLVAANLPDEADKYLKRFPKDTRETAEFLSVDYLVMSKTRTLQVLIDEGRKLLRNRVFHPLIDKILLQALRDAGMKDAAEALAEASLKRWSK